MGSCLFLSCGWRLPRGLVEPSPMAAEPDGRRARAPSSAVGAMLTQGSRVGSLKSGGLPAVWPHIRCVSVSSRTESWNAVCVGSSGKGGISRGVLRQKLKILKATSLNLDMKVLQGWMCLLTLLCASTLVILSHRSLYVFQ